MNWYFLSLVLSIICFLGISVYGIVRYRKEKAYGVYYVVVGALLLGSIINLIRIGVIMIFP